MGILTTVAGTIEVISALTMDNIKSTVKDGKDIVRIMKEKDSKEKSDVKDLDIEIKEQ